MLEDYVTAVTVSMDQLWSQEKQIKSEPVTEIQNISQSLQGEEFKKVICAWPSLLLSPSCVDNKCTYIEHIWKINLSLINNLWDHIMTFTKKKTKKMIKTHEV